MRKYYQNILSENKSLFLIKEKKIINCKLYNRRFWQMRLVINVVKVIIGKFVDMVVEFFECK